MTSSSTGVQAGKMPSPSCKVVLWSWMAYLVATNVDAILDTCGGAATNGQACYTTAYDRASGCSTVEVSSCTGGTECYQLQGAPDENADTACKAVGCKCYYGVCWEADNSEYCLSELDVCGDDVICDDPHMQGLRGQRIDWSGVDGGWYSLVKDPQVDLNINVRLTAPLPDEFADRQLITGVSIISGRHSLVVEVENPYTIATEGCPTDLSPCLANGGLRAIVDGEGAHDLLRFSRKALVSDGEFSVSASNLPVECRQFGGDKIWALMYEEMLQGGRVLGGEESFEDWILGFHNMAAPEWCTKYIAEHDLAELQSTHAIFKIETPTVTVRLNAGVNHQDSGEQTWDGRDLPALEFWQMDIGLDGLDVDSPSLTGILGETARPVYDESGHAVKEGLEAIRGDVDDYFVHGPMGTHFALLDKKDEGHE